MAEEAIKTFSEMLLKMQEDYNRRVESILFFGKEEMPTISTPSGMTMKHLFPEKSLVGEAGWKAYCGEIVSYPVPRSGPLGECPECSEIWFQKKGRVFPWRKYP